MKKIVLVLIMCLTSSCFVGCANKHDYVDIHNRTQFKLDNIGIDVKDGYFYDRHEKFTVDENTIGLTIYFTKDSEESWDSEVAENE